MPSDLIDLFLVTSLLVSGIGSFVVLGMKDLPFKFLPFPAKVLIAASCRTLSLLFYRY